MGSNKHLKEEAISLRKKGKSYSEILKALKIKSKGTLSLWFKDLKLSEESRKLLDRNNLLAHERGLFKANSDRNNKIKIENHEAYIEGYGDIKSMSKRELMLIGASLYWAEGSKSERMTSTPLDFCNSDPRMIIIYMRFIREILQIPEERIRSGIHIYPTISEDGAREYWARITKLPKDRFYIITQISKASKGVRPINTLPYGTISIRISNRIQFHKVKGMINGIIEGLNK